MRHTEPVSSTYLLLLIAGSAAVAGLAQRFKMSAPLVLVLVGLVVSYLPGTPVFRLDPELVLLFVLPPLLYTAAMESSYLSLRANIRPIAMLSVGYVLFSMLLVGYVMYLLVPGLPLAAALLLGAVIAPPDAVAATAVARRAGLPPRITTLLQGESLVNDATAITAFRGTVAAATGAGITWLGGIGEFLLAAIGGVLVGLVIAVPIQWLRSRLTDPRLQTTFALLIPFAAYSGAESFEASGVLAVVVVALYLGHHADHTDFATRLTEESVWKTVAFVLESAVFALIGLQLRYVVDGVADRGVVPLIGWSAALLGTLIAGRFLWCFPATFLPRVLSRRIREREPDPGWKGPTIVAWAGMRGVVSLAVAFSVPELTEAGLPFPERNLILFLTFVAVIGTLIVQGFSLPWLIRRLNLPGTDPQAWTLAEAQAQSEASRKAVERLDVMLEEPANHLPEPLAARLRTVLERRQNSVWERLGAANPLTGESVDEVYRRVARELIEVERATFVRLRDERRIGDVMLRKLMRRLDFEEAAATRAEEH
jgi:CPA1 family monovalent cation:H+ antiporter